MQLHSSLQFFWTTQRTKTWISIYFPSKISIKPLYFTTETVLSGLVGNIHLFKSFCPFILFCISEFLSLFYSVISNFLVFQPHNKVSEFIFIWRLNKTFTWRHVVMGWRAQILQKRCMVLYLYKTIGPINQKFFLVNIFTLTTGYLPFTWKVSGWWYPKAFSFRLNMLIGLRKWIPVKFLSSYNERLKNVG